ncbi:dienelactone hydrolase family protein [Telluria aromaticivorans]|uniref:Dienelactone hydrolase family protein n=1 Tax=Telluria aromaticivorans TaxID=2725995 RepID=A0A7Y2K2V0_9BURK|nr:dienelactone hydrolase family protein [Telluria aromaticivorans]NNG25298.1 dienelactone hydrolase family protein [Telluria aromaticivorans]
MTEQLQIQAPDGSFACHVARPSTPGPHPVVIVLQEIFGVNAGIRSIATDYASKGYIAVCPDLFWRIEPGVFLSEAREGDWEKAFALYKAYEVNKGVDDIALTIKEARGLQDANGKVGVTGYCLGGLMTFLSAARTDGDAFAAYYGGGTDQHVGEAANIKAPLLYHLAEEDEFISKDAQAKIRAALAGKAELHSYPGCNHAFARPGGNHYDAAAATLAASRTEAFFARTLR